MKRFPAFFAVVGLFALSTGMAAYKGYQTGDWSSLDNSLRILGFVSAFLISLGGMFFAREFGHLIAAKRCSTKLEYALLGPAQFMRIADGTVRFRWKAQARMFMSSYLLGERASDPLVRKHILRSGLWTAAAFGLGLMAAVALGMFAELSQAGQVLFVVCLLPIVGLLWLFWQATLLPELDAQGQAVDRLSKAIAERLKTRPSPSAEDEPLYAEAEPYADEPNYGLAVSLPLYYYYTQTGQTEKALARIGFAEKQFEQAPDLFQWEIGGEAAFAYAIFGKDAKAARQRYESNKEGLVWLRSYALINRVEAALAYAEGRMDDTETLVEKGLADLEGKTAPVSASQLPAETARNLLHSIPV